ncbi:MAG: chromosome segregation protein SMC [bacterium]
MYIKELQIFGFKSFQEKTTIRFSPGLNCIAGPNGCGKSNILDALRWVLGEQSFAVLRCAKTEDLIFAGTATTPAVNYAEVKLLLSNNDRPDAADILMQQDSVTEVEVRRRFFRSGESEYYLNRQLCRLRDVQDFFLSQGLGSKAYSIFDLRQIREIIAGNIRKMFEEAASLAKFREAKEECQRKLDLTQTDLTRLEDIIAERERIVRSLQRQAGKLRAFQRLKEEEKGLRLIELKKSYDLLTAEWERVKREVALSEQAAAERVGEIKRLEEELRLLRSRLLNAEKEREIILFKVQGQREKIAEIEKAQAVEQQEIAFLQQRAEEAKSTVDRLDKDIVRLEELFTLTVKQLAERNSRLDKLQQQLEKMRLKTREHEEGLYSLREEKKSLRERLQNFLEEEQQLRNALAKVEAEIENASVLQERINQDRALLIERGNKIEQEINELRVVVDKVRMEKQALQGRIGELGAAIKDINRRQQEVKKYRVELEEEKNLLERELANIRVRFAREETAVARDVLGEELTSEAGKFLKPMAGWERACEAAFFPLLDFIVCSGIDSERWAVLEKDAGKLRIGFIAEIEDGGIAEIGPVFIKDERVVGVLADFVQIEPNAPTLLIEMVRKFVVVRDRGALEDLRREFPGHYFVAQDGVAWFGDGRLVFVGSGASRLALGREIEEKEGRLRGVRENIERLNREEVEEDSRKTALERDLEVVESGFAVAEKEQMRVESKQEMYLALRAGLEREGVRLQEETSRLDKLLERLEDKRIEISGQLTKIAKDMGAIRSELERVERTTEEREAVVKSQLNQGTELLSELSEERRQIERLEVESGHIRQEMEAKRHQIEEMRRIIDLAAQQQTAAAAKEKTRQEAVERLQTELKAMEKELERFSTLEVARAVETLEKNIDELRYQQEQVQKMIFERRLRVAELEGKIKTVTEEAHVSYQTDIATFVPETIEGFEERLKKVRHRIEVLGQVNPLAATEYEEERKDLERLLFQRNDVMQAREILQQSLVEIDRHAREQFIATYQKVRAEFQKIFKELFLEGEADLVLINEANPLESEVGIIAKPRGKNPKRIEQLSDGEKALLAVSLLFAFYQVKPAPFCFLDEVDAPLDDVNVGRFADYLKRLSARTQVIVITHNRSTVERADVLLGVTAEQTGISRVVSVSLAEYRAKENHQVEEKSEE